eukprot:2785467-Amphidinium_carterae.1
MAYHMPCYRPYCVLRSLTFPRSSCFLWAEGVVVEGGWNSTADFFAKTSSAKRIDSTVCSMQNAQEGSQAGSTQHPAAPTQSDIGAAVGEAPCLDGWPTGSENLEFGDDVPTLTVFGPFRE